MSRRKVGKRHTLLMYKQAMDRLWQATLPLGLILAVTWWQASLGRISLLRPPWDEWFFVAVLVVLAFTIFTLLARRMSYVQPRRDLVRIVTPFLRLNVSYRRVRSVSASEFHRLFPPRPASWGTRRFLRPFYGRTAVVLELFDYPLPRHLLRFFLPVQMFSPVSTGFVLVVSDWMGLSTEIDSLRADWQAAQKPKPTGLGLYR